MYGFALLAALVCGQADGTKTTNFVVRGADQEEGRKIAESAEKYRKELAKLWLGKDLADWSEPCPIQATIHLGNIEGTTEVEFGRDRVVSQKMTIKGPLERVLQGSLPHEMTHVIFAHHFKCKVPRWADEGAAILSEDSWQGERQRRALRKIVAENRCFALRRLLEMQEYPPDVSCLYAQGHSVARFLVTAKGHKTFLSFVRDGMDKDWDHAAQTHFGHKNVEHLEKAWRGWLERKDQEATGANPFHGSFLTAN